MIEDAIKAEIEREAGKSGIDLTLKRSAVGKS
jgi:hypothetical protein